MRIHRRDDKHIVALLWHLKPNSCRIERKYLFSPKLLLALGVPPINLFISIASLPEHMLHRRSFTFLWSDKNQFCQNVGGVNISPPRVRSLKLVKWFRVLRKCFDEWRAWLASASEWLRNFVNFFNVCTDVRSSIPLGAITLCIYRRSAHDTPIHRPSCAHRLFGPELKLENLYSYEYFVSLGGFILLFVKWS